MTPPMAMTTVFLMLLSCLMVQSQEQDDSDHEDLSFPLISCPNGSHAWKSNCYALDITPKSWHDAEESCEKWPSGHLVSVLSKTEASFVSSLVTSIADKYQLIWIGLHDPTAGHESHGHHWRWSNGQVLKYQNWEINSSTASHHGYCASLTDKSGYMKWRNFPCDKLLPYICKLKY